MSQHRTPSKRSKYYLPKETFLTVVHYCKQYPLWVHELTTLQGTKGIAYDGDRVQTSHDSDPTYEMAMKREEYRKKKDKVDEVACFVAGGMAEWIVRGACYDMPFYKLRQDGIPCEKNLYYRLRRRFYYEMSKKI